MNFRNIVTRIITRATTHLFWRGVATTPEPPREAWRVRDDLDSENGLSYLLPAATLARVFTTSLTERQSLPEIVIGTGTRSGKLGES